MNTEHFPKSANSWDSLADAFSYSGDIASAVHNYQKALETDPGYSNADFAKKFVAEHWTEIVGTFIPPRSMLYERAALVEWSIGRGCRARIRGEDRQIG